VFTVKIISPLRTAAWRRATRRLKHADAGGAADFVAGEGEEIATHLLHIHGHVPGTLRTVHQRGDAELARAGAHR
jgi:hypothetical protein